MDSDTGPRCEHGIEFPMDNCVKCLREDNELLAQGFLDVTSEIHKFWHGLMATKTKKGRANFAVENGWKLVTLVASYGIGIRSGDES